jgi:hypothetical protein
VQTEQPAPIESAAVPQAAVPINPSEPPESPARPEPPKHRFQPDVPPPPAAKPDGSAISQAVNEVMQAIESLKQAMEQMEEALELVELAERQKLADEHEIDSLRRLLHQLHRPRGDRDERHEHDS